MSGRLGDLNEKQNQRLQQLKQNIQDVMTSKHDDSTLLRFLRARNFDLKATEKMFRKDVEWRSVTKTDTIVDDYTVPEVIAKHYVGGSPGYDKEGAPVWIFPVGEIDVKGLVYSCKASDLLRFNVYILEKLYKDMEEQSKKIGKHVEGMTYIMDLGKLGLHHLWKPGIDLFNQFISMFEQHYPETLKSVFIVRAPKFFPLAYSLVKPFLHEYTRKKIHVLGSNWKEALLKHIDADVLPVFWGGNATDPDGNVNCRSKIQMGGEVPKSFYLKDRELSSKNLITKQISRGSAIEMKYIVTKPGSVIRYEFKTHDHDIAFGIKRLGAENEKTVIKKTERYNSHMVPEDGEVILDDPGQYVVKFDNSYSWTKTKTVSFCIELLEPQDIDEAPEFEVDPEKFENLNLFD
ncbi:SEC14-like protein 2 [Anneissia japonica]|uniref:SEC14-like protein 2 n=1 Tax=Anneissia japonica TaxID=1529436 RepID=UPI0014255F89|nr:SEC14-like protein 2 [Anneissia japonica]